MRALRKGGLSYEKIAAQLDAESVRPRKGTSWSGWTVNQILAREVDNQRAAQVLTIAEQQGFTRE